MNAEFGLRGQTVKFKWVGSKSMLFCTGQGGGKWGCEGFSPPAQLCKGAGWADSRSGGFDPMIS